MIEKQIKTLLERYAKEGHVKLRRLVAALLASPDGYSCLLYTSPSPRDS